MDDSSWLEDWLTDDIGPLDCALASEAALADCWNRPEEDLAWAYLQIYAVPQYPLIGWRHDPRAIPGGY
jgi:hypothetical protein